MTLDRAEKIVGIAKEIILIIAIIVGGGWAFYRFVVIESATAKIAYEKALANSKAFGMQVSIDTETYTDRGCTVFGTIAMQNLGSEMVSVDLRHSKPIAVAPVVFDDGEGHFVDPKAVRYHWIDDVDRTPRLLANVVPGRKVTLPFAFVVPKPSLYMMRFAAPVVFSRSSDRSVVNRWSERKIFRACAGEGAG